MYTSLVFLVVLGIWAAYLVQQWMRRREHLLTARSVDAFTEALRVLERRPAAPSTTTPDRARSYAVSPLRTRPEVVVKHAGSTSVSAVRADARRGARGRAASLVVAVTLVVGAVVLAVLGHVGWYVPVLAGLLLAADVAYLRWSATQLRGTVRRSAPAAARPTQRVATVGPEAVEPAQETTSRVEPGAETVKAEADGPAEADAPVAPSPSAGPVLFDVRAFDEPAAPAAEEPLAPGTWRPTPVPAPLYTRKATLPEPAPRPYLVESDTVLSPVELDDDVLELESPFRRVVNG